MFLIRTLITISLVLFSCFAMAQISAPGTPVSNTIKLSEIDVLTMPSIDMATLKAEDEEDLASNLPLRFAFGHRVAFNTKNSGTWEALPNGDRVWRLSIYCPEALNINFLYDDFYLPKGAQLFIYNSDKSQTLGAFTSANNKETGRFATALIHDEVATLEYVEPARIRGKGRIQIAQIGHGYRPMNVPAAENSGQLGNSGDCQVNVNCSEGANWQDQKKGVAKIIMDGLYLCSGSLVNNTANDCKPLFLTANHCLQGGIPQDAILNPDVSGYVFYWNFEYQTCSNSGFVPEQTTSGGTVLANSGPNTTGTYTLTGSDFGLIQLDENPRDAYDVYFNGWDATGDQGNTGVGIHHPGGDAKKISTHSISPDLDGYYWALFWQSTPNGHSVTEGGSSGSPLFRETGQIIGQLFGGGSVNCDDPANDLGLYGRMDYSWTNDDDVLSSDPRRRLNEWLDPIGNGSIRSVPGAYDPCELPKVYFPATNQTIDEGNAVVDNECLDYTDYSFDIAITPYPTAPVDVAIEAMAGSGVEEGPNRDFELLTPVVTFNSIFNQQTIQVRVYNDEYIENTESVDFSFDIMGDAAGLGANEGHNIQILDDDNAPTSHIQSVSNEESPDEVYLGPGATVYFKDPGSGGVMLMVENLSGHDFGCTQVAVDQAGGSANNNWNSGSTTSKSYQLMPAFPNTNAPVQVTAFYTNSELNGWEWFNGTPDTRDDLQLYAFDGAAVAANEASAQTGATSSGSSNGGTTFTTSFNGLNATTGLTGGVLQTSQGLRFAGNGMQTNAERLIQDLSVAPNPATTQLQVQWQTNNPGATTLRILDMTGRQLSVEQLMSDVGINNQEVSLGGLLPGVYLMQVQTADGNAHSIRFVKQ